MVDKVTLEQVLSDYSVTPATSHSNSCYIVSLLIASLNKHTGTRTVGVKENTLFWDVSPCGHVKFNLGFRGKYCLLIQAKGIPEGSTLRYNHSIF
jgi:hypothetical protein